MSSWWFQVFVPTDINTFLKDNPKNQPARDSGALVNFALIPNNMVDRISLYHLAVLPSQRGITQFLPENRPQASLPGGLAPNLWVSQLDPAPFSYFLLFFFNKMTHVEMLRFNNFGSPTCVACIVAYCLIGDSMLYHVFEASTYSFLIIRIIWNDLLELRGIMISDNTRFTKVAEAGRSQSRWIIFQFVVSKFLDQTFVGGM